MTPPRGTVFLIAQPTVSSTGEQPNLTGLQHHGRVVTLVQSGDNPLYRPRKCAENIARRLEGFNPEQDFFVSAGGGMLAALMVGWVIRHCKISRFRWLSYQRPPKDSTTPGTYRALWVDFTQYDFDDEQEAVNGNR